MSFLDQPAKRRHHYVWRYYLGAWVLNNKVFCLMNGKIFEPNPIRVGIEKDFYAMSELSDEDIIFIRRMAIGNDQGLKKKMYDEIIDNYKIRNYSVYPLVAHTP
jgi:hypothetical protein